MNITLVDVNKDVCEAWYKEFSNIEGFDIVCGSIFEVGADAIVSPANSFGFMDGGLDYRILRHLSTENTMKEGGGPVEEAGHLFQKRVIDSIRTCRDGELLVGDSLMLQVPVYYSSPLKYIIVAPTMRVPMVIKDTVNVYLAFKSIFKHSKFCNKIAVSGMGTGVGKVSPEICARQMRRAYDDWKNSNYPTGFREAQLQHLSLYSDSQRDMQYD